MNNKIRREQGFWCISYKNGIFLLEGYTQDKLCVLKTGTAHPLPDFSGCGRTHRTRSKGAPEHTVMCWNTLKHSALVRDFNWRVQDLAISRKNQTKKSECNTRPENLRVHAPVAQNWRLQLHPSYLLLHGPCFLLVWNKTSNSTIK